ncbi:hypothetical protein HOLleu_09379 [Holothuria leucospilota]|uniref:Ig-like domain-containing protein n=1 Tax=Holothuria leucospilota TaxID=206669 RepID=A0A9Q1CCV1_HOLLE|nr:hypothetical protein HOLleu_09379 [Holothuria leucospilota]
MTGLGHTAFLACLLVTNFGPVKPVESDGHCPSPQYAEIGQEGVIECSVPLTFEGVVWYNSTNTTDSLVARIERQSDGSLRISGEGVNTGSYTIASNGSLIITEVTTKHNRNFTVLILNEMYEASSFTVELITLVYSRQRFPAVNSYEANLILLEPVTRNATLSCSFQGVRPAVTLSWFKFNKGKFENFEATQYSSSDDGLSFSSVSDITIPNLTYNSLHLFSCRAYGPAVRVKEARTDVLVIAEIRRMKSGRKCHTEIRKETVFADSALQIPCTEDAHPYAFIWQFAETNHSQILMLSVNGMVRSLNKMNTTMDVSTDGSLLFPNVDRSMKGVYTCFFLMGDTSSCNNVELQVKARVGIKTEDNSRAASVSPWMIIPFVVTAFVALLIFVYVLDRHRQVSRPFNYYQFERFPHFGEST